MKRCIAALALLLFGIQAANAETGLLIFAHGNHSMGGYDMSTHTDAPGAWNANVLELARSLDAQPTEVAFGMAEPPSPCG